MTNVAIENHHFSWENPLFLAIFKSYVQLPEGTMVYKKTQLLYVDINDDICRWKHDER